MPNKFTLSITFLLFIFCISLNGQDDKDWKIVAYYPLDGDGKDLGKFKNSGELLGTPKLVENRIDEMEAIEFDGNDWVECSPHPLNIKNNVSISLWVKTNDEETKTATLFGKYNPEEFRGFNILMNYGKVQIFGRDGTPPNKEKRRRNYRGSGKSTTMIADGEWHHIVGIIELSLIHI